LSSWAAGSAWRALPHCAAFKARECVTVIMGARSSDLLIYERNAAGLRQVLVTTDDGARAEGCRDHGLKQELDTAALAWS